MRSGLVSVTFRKLSVEEIIGLCKACGLEEIEWGGDIHVPLGDLDAAGKARRLTRQAGLNVACYGSYVRMTREERPLFPRLAATAGPWARLPFGYGRAGAKRRTGRKSLRVPASCAAWRRT